MKKKRPKRKATRPRSSGSDSKEGEQSPALLQYKVIELSTVDELSLERAINDRVAEGWRLDGIHFAMRDSSKRPAMAFLLFIKAGSPAAREQASGDSGAAVARGARTISEGAAIPIVSSDPWKRLRELAGVEGEGEQEDFPRRPG